ncbi:unnamed protein product [Protopolystoma xenopodis]|uniref:Uncharacterized protein n=1 Tax=Protopolystoma xenopodis TaxID=117903 RepID=A0A3S5FER4_9PLAT|nr:unnamed protein product [Protopolystoma xenopodis]
MLQLLRSPSFSSDNSSTNPSALGSGVSPDASPPPSILPKLTFAEIRLVRALHSALAQIPRRQLLQNHATFETLPCQKDSLSITSLPSTYRPYHYRRFTDSDLADLAESTASLGDTATYFLLLGHKFALKTRCPCRQTDFISISSTNYIQRGTQPLVLPVEPLSPNCQKRLLVIFAEWVHLIYLTEFVR